MTTVSLVIGQPDRSLRDGERAVYFTRVSDGYIPNANSSEEAHDLMCRAFEMGTLNSDSLNHLESLFHNVSYK